MSEVVKLLRRRGRILLCLFVVSCISSFGLTAATAQSTPFSEVERCAALPSAAPVDPFDGLLVTIGDDAARAFRAGVATTYVLAFGGGNFLPAGAVSPSGEYFAVPNGIITTVSNSDVRYTVQEIRVMTTGTVPRIAARVAWRASFPVGTLFTSSGDIPRIRWLDDTRIAFVTGSLSEEQALVEVDVFAGTAPIPVAGGGLLAISPDGSRGMGMIDGLRVLIDATSGETIAQLPQTPDGMLHIAWSPDSAQFAMTDLVDGAVALSLYDANGQRTETVTVLPPEQVLWNLRWSPDGTALAYSAFDPQSIVNRLHVVDLSARTVTDTCLPLVADVDGRGIAALAWSPDSTRIALLTRQTSADTSFQIYMAATGSRYTLVSAAGRVLGWYP